MATYAEALNIVLNNVHPLGIEEKTLEEAQGQVLAEDIYSEYNFPQRDIRDLMAARLDLQIWS